MHRLSLLSLSVLLILLSLSSMASVASDSHAEQAINKPSQNCLTLMPCPKHLASGVGTFTLTASPSLFIKGMSKNRKQMAIKRLSEQFSKIPDYHFAGFTLVENSDLADVKVVIKADNQQAQDNNLPKIGDNESYQLNISQQAIHIQAVTDFGALHALTSLVQIIAMADNRSKTELSPKILQLPVVTITDEPRFKWRGLLIDSVRHFMPISAIKRQLDGMAAAKLNVFHWHLTDDQGWRIELNSYPKLHQVASDGLYYSQQEIKDLVAYASNLGIRVVPELDLPGHASAIAVAYPELMAAQTPNVMERHWGVFEPLLDVSNPNVYRFIDVVVGELTRLFPDEYLHIGGDEVNPKQWENNSNIKALMAKNAIKDAYGLHSYFNVKLQQILAKHQRKMMGWDEILHKNLPKDIVVQSWRGLQSLNVIASSGYQALLSAGYYIDQPQATSYHYRNEPLANITLGNEKAYQARKITKKAGENWQTWAFTMPRLKGSAVKGMLTLITHKAAKKLSGYLKLNDHYYQKVTFHSSVDDLHANKVVFSHDSWMGPMRFELAVLKGGMLSGFTMIGNSYYSVEGKESSKLEKLSIDLQPLLAIEQATNILGGEATLWSEMVDEQNIDLRTWPRLFAIAERFWSPKSLTDSHYMYQRLMTINNYAAKIIGLQHQQQQESGFSRLISTLPENEDNIEALLTLAQALEPAHYYTRHHLKYQQNQYHQNAALDNFVDYLPVESFTLITMQNDLARYQQGDNTALLNIKQQLLLWQQSAQHLSSLIIQDDKPTSLSNVIADVKVFNELALTLVNRCISENFYNQKEALILDEQFIALQKDSKETVIAAVPLMRSLLSYCLVSNSQVSNSN
ncbi:MAG: family 20 glycosylhydrolase [Cognaticolwellia aestuarii]